MEEAPRLLDASVSNDGSVSLCTVVYATLVTGCRLAVSESRVDVLHATYKGGTASLAILGASSKLGC